MGHHNLLRRGMAAGLMLAGAACAPEPRPRVELTQTPLTEDRLEQWLQPAIESGQPEITVRRAFRLRDACRQLRADAMLMHWRLLMLRVESSPADEGCPAETGWVGYAATVSGLEPGEYQLRVVHVRANGMRTGETVLQHAVLVEDGGFLR